MPSPVDNAGSLTVKDGGEDIEQHVLTGPRGHMSIAVAGPCR